MATSKTPSVAPVEAPVVEAAPVAAPVAPDAPAATGLFNMPRLTAKPQKQPEAPTRKIVIIDGDRITLSGVTRSAAAPVEKAKPAFKSIEESLK
jgi:hypothetical protein